MILKSCLVQNKESYQSSDPRAAEVNGSLSTDFSGFHRLRPGSAPLLAILHIITRFRAQINEKGAFYSYET